MNCEVYFTVRMTGESEYIHKIESALKKHRRGLTISDLSKELSLNRNSVAKYLAILQSTGRVDREEHGTARVYFLSQRVPVSSLVNFSSELVVMLDERGIIVRVNDRVVRLFSTAREDIEGKPIDQAPVEFLRGLWGLETMKPEYREREGVMDISSTVSGDLHHFRVKTLPTLFEDGGHGVTILIEDVTQQKRYEQELVESEARYRAVVEDQTDLICRRLPDGTVTFVNEAFARFFGKKQEDFIGKVFSPDDPPEEFSNVEASRVPFILPVVTGIVEHQILLENGETRWIQWKNRALQDETGNPAEIQSVGRDTTRQREREKEIAIKECAIARSPHPYIIWETMGRVVYVNGAFLSLFGYRDEREVVGRYMDRYLPRTGTENNVMQVISSLTETGRWDGIMEARKRDGTIVSVEARANLMKNDPYLPTGGGIALLSECSGENLQEIEQSGCCQVFHADISHENPGPAPGTPGHSPIPFEEMLDPLPTPTFVVDREKRVIAWNGAIERVSGIRREEILGTTGYSRAFSAYGGRVPILIDLLDLPDDILAKEYPDVQRVGDSIVTEIFIPSSGGVPDSYILGRAGPLCAPDGNLAGFIMGLQDLSEWKSSQMAMDRFKGKIDAGLSRLMSQLEQRSCSTTNK